jgi:hypothetical protein
MAALPPLCIGVTGHRDVTDGPALRAALRAILDRLRHAAGARPLLIANGLAAGADAIATEVALAMAIPVLAVLPFPVAAYRDDFPPGPARDAFHDRLRRCQGDPLEMPPAASRDDGYVALGWHLARHARVLIAVWDGDGFDRAEVPPGGTAHVVRLFSGRDRPPGYTDPHPPPPPPREPSRILAHVCAGRAGRPHPDEGQVRWLLATGPTLTPMPADHPWWASLATHP